MRILLADDETAKSKTLRPLFGAAAKRQPKRRGAGANDIGRLVVACAPKKGAKGRVGAAARGGVSLDLADQPEQAAAILDALGISLLNRGLLEEGSKLIVMALEIRRKFFGNDHPATAASLNSYSRVQRERGDYKGATESVQNALRINRRVFGDHSLPVAVSLYELGVVQLQQGLLADARQSAQDGLKILQDLGLDSTDPNTTRLMDVLGRAQNSLGNPNDASVTYEALLKLDYQQLGTRQHPKYATHLANFGLVKEAQKKRRQADAAYRNAIDLYANSLNRQQHPNLIDAYANLGSLLRTPPTPPKALKEAGRYLQKALELDLIVRGDSHPMVGNDYSNLGRWQYDTGATKEAIKSFARALDIYSTSVSRGALPMDHYFLAEVLTWQARLWVEQDTTAGARQAQPLLEQAIKIWPVQLGPDTAGEGLAKAYLGRALYLIDAANAAACDLLCEGFRIVKCSALTSPELVRRLAGWIKQQKCNCKPVAAVK